MSVLGIIGIIAVVLYLADRALGYYCATLGLLYYLGTQHDDLLSAEKVKELRSAALNRRVKELFGGH